MIRDIALGLFSALFKTGRILHSPLNVQIEPTTHCNLNCRMCIRRDVVKEPAHMEENVFHTAVKKLTPHRVVFAGSGEPLLHPQMPDMIRYLKRSRIRTMISTNLLVGREAIRAAAEAGIDVIKISIDAPDGATYRSIRGSGDFDRLLDNIRFVRTQASSGTDLRFECVLMKENVGALDRLILLASDLKINRVYFRELQTFGMDDARRRELLNGFDLDLMERSLAAAAALARTRGIRTNAGELLGQFKTIRSLYSSELTSRFSSACLLPWLAVFVSVKGDTAPCCALYINAGVKTGNVMEHSRDELLNGPPVACIRRAFKNGKVSPVCRDCLPRDFGRLFTMVSALPKYF